MFPQEHLDYLMEIAKKLPKNYRDDIVSDIFIYVEERKIDLTAKKNPRKYLQNRMYKLFKQRLTEKRDHQLFETYDPPGKIEEMPLFKLSLSEVQDAIDQLPEKLRVTLETYLDCCSYQKTAEILEVGTWTVNLRIQRICHLLRMWVSANKPEYNNFL